MNTTRKLFLSTLATAVVLLSTMSVRAEQPDKYTKPHEPFTAYGMQVRMSLINPIDNTWHKGVQPTVFQEIAPCRLLSTLNADRYDTPWGGTSYRPNESRFYRSSGVLETPVFVDPCSEAIPIEAIGIVGRFTVTPGDGDGEVRIDSSKPASPNATTVFKFRKGEVLMFEAGVLFGPGGTFGVQTWNAGADVTIDVLGFLLPDPAPAGAKGDRGDKGDQGVAGVKGDTGATGAQGDQGVAGVKGDTGAKGDQGIAGVKGDTGATGAKGDQGVAGVKGDTGDTGAQGDQGLPGAKGDTGATGAKGDQGVAGVKGDTGATGAKGDTGPQGAIGPMGHDGPAGPAGAKGDTGPQGAVGPIGPSSGSAGPKGDTGPQGAIGPMGHEGPSGPAGPKGDRGDPGVGLTVTKGNGCYPPGNNANSQVTVFNAAVSPSSVVILNYTDAGSNGNALAIIGQGRGFFQTTGSPNKCFQYAVFNIAQ